MCDFQKRIAQALVADRPRDVQTRRIGGDDRITAFEQQLLCHRYRLARLGIAGHLHQDFLSRCQPLDLAQECAAVRGFQEHAALPFHGLVGNRTVHRAGARGVAVDDQVVQLAINHQRGGFGPVQMVQNDRIALHVLPQSLTPAAVSSPAVSASGRPTMPVNDPEIHGISAPAGPWMP